MPGMGLSEKLKLEVIFAAAESVVRPMKAIQKQSRETASALKGARDELKALNSQQKLIDQWRSTGKGIGINKQDLEKAQALVKKLADEMNATAAPTVKMQRAFKEATEDARNLAATANRLQEKKQRLRGEMSALGIDTKKLTDYQRTLKSQMDTATAAVDKQAKAAERLGKRNQALHAAQAKAQKLREVGGKAMMAGAAVNAVAAVPVLAYAKAEDSATQLKIAMMQAGGVVSEEFKEISDLANRLGNKLPGNTSDFQDMMTMLIRQGMPAKNLLGGLGEATAYLAVQLKMAPTAAAEFASKLQDATRTTNKDMMGLMDTIQKTFYLGVDSNNMLAGFAKLSPALSVLRMEGLAASRALAPLLVMADQAGMAGESAGNAYRKIFQLSLDKRRLDKGNDELEGTGIKLDFSDGKGEFGGLDKMYAELAKLRGVDTQRRLAALKKIFGDDAETLQALTLMIEKGVGGYREVQAKMDAQASLQERVTAQLGTLNSLWDAASGTFTNLLVTLGESIAPELHATAKWIGEIAEKTQVWAKENPGLSAALMTVIKYVGLVLIVAGGLAVALSTVLVPLVALKFGLAMVVPWLGGVAGGVWAIIKGIGYLAGFIGGKLLLIGKVLLTNPIFLAAAALAGLAYLIYSNWDSIKKWWDDMWRSIDVAWKLVSSELKAWWESFSLYEVGKNVILSLTNGLLSGVPGLKTALQWVANLMPGTVNKELDIKSPSRVFAAIGGYTMEGLEQGILRGQDGPLAALAKAAKGITAAGAGMLVSGAAMAMPALDTRPPLGMGGGMMGGGAPMIVQITINPSPGMDEQALARHVAAELEKIEARRAARGRSRLADRD